MRNMKDMNRISFLNRGYTFKGLLAVFDDNHGIKLLISSQKTVVGTYLYHLTCYTLQATRCHSKL